MTFNGNGDYSGTYVVNRDGAVTVSVELARKGGLTAEYFNNAFLYGVPALKQVDNFMNFTWGAGLVTPQASDFVSAHWYGKLLAPYSEDFTFILNGDDGFRFYLADKLLIDRWDHCCDEMQVRVFLEQGKLYDIVIEYKELQDKAAFSFEWSSPTLTRSLVPPSNLYYSQRISNQVYQVTVAKGPSIPSKSTIESTAFSLQAGKLSSTTIQSRDLYGSVLDNTRDEYQISFAGPAELFVEAVY